MPRHALEPESKSQNQRAVSQSASSGNREGVSLPSIGNSGMRHFLLLLRKRVPRIGEDAHSLRMNKQSLGSERTPIRSGWREPSTQQKILPKERMSMPEMERVACFVSERSPPNFAPEYMPGPLCCRPVPWRVSVYANPGGGRNSVPRQSAKYSSQCPPFPPPPRRREQKEHY